MLSLFSTLRANLQESLMRPEVGTAIVLVAAMALEATKPGSGKKGKRPMCRDEKRRANHHYHSHIHLWIGD